MLAVLVLSAPALTLYVAPLIPVVVALVTKAKAPQWVKAGVLVVLAAVSALVTPVIQNGGSLTVDRAFVGAFAVSLVGAIAAHFGIGKPLGITGSEGVIAQNVPGGLG